MQLQQLWRRQTYSHHLHQYCSQQQEQGNQAAQGTQVLLQRLCLQWCSWHHLQQYWLLVVHRCPVAEQYCPVVPA
jgi:hypothetical protein